MALVAIAIHDTDENKRSVFTRQCLDSLATTVDWSKHRLFLIDNGSCALTKAILDAAALRLPFTRIENTENLGTARAINKAWLHRNPGEHCLKMDNDIIVRESGWLDTLELCIARDQTIGVIGLKRKDCAESPNAPKRTWSHSQLHMLPQEQKKLERWLIVEIVEHVIGSCQLYNSALLEKIGYLVQFGQYGLDDCIACCRSKVAGFFNCFYPHYEIDHIDPGGTAYQDWKSRYAGERMAKYDKLRGQFQTASRSLFFGPDEDLDKEFI